MVVPVKDAAKDLRFLNPSPSQHQKLIVDVLAKVVERNVKLLLRRSQNQKLIVDVLARVVERSVKLPQPQHPNLLLKLLLHRSQNQKLVVDVPAKVVERSKLSPRTGCVLNSCTYSSP